MLHQKLIKDTEYQLCKNIQWVQWVRKDFIRSVMTHILFKDSSLGKVIRPTEEMSRQWDSWEFHKMTGPCLMAHQQILQTESPASPHRAWHQYLVPARKHGHTAKNHQIFEESLQCERHNPKQTTKKAVWGKIQLKEK